MRVITETNKINVAYEYEVCVCGGGFAGVAAAIASARSGAKTCLIEKSFMLGGLGTAGLITIYLPLCDGCGNQVSFGLAEELLKLSVEHGVEARYPKAWFENGSFDEKKNGQRYEVQFNANLCAISMEQLLIKEGVDILYGTQVCNVNKTGDKISEIIIENKSGRQAISVKSVVDATGDADICHFAGEETDLFEQGNLLAAWHYYYKNGGVHLQQLGAADIPDEHKTEERKGATSLVPQRFTGLDGTELSEMTKISHEFILKSILEKREALNDESIVPTMIPTIPQIRMTRKIVGIYTMTEADDHKDLYDSVGMFADWKKRGPCYQLSFGSLYGKRVKNLITAGRCISSDQTLWDVTRVIPVCSVTGEAAGTAAALTDDFSALDIEKLQNELIRKGVRIK
ncbi:MAG: FAD-dependent oxidoreductase [Clostridia bacterium]|nr:FAD-dependent oxidoreductase [Clostridia bacterium]